MSNIDYAEQVALIENKLSTSHINSRALQEPTILLVLSESLTVTQIAEENMSIPQGQDMNNTITNVIRREYGQTLDRVRVRTEIDNSILLVYNGGRAHDLEVM